jgi:hypothetical protein
MKQSNLDKLKDRPTLLAMFIRHVLHNSPNPFDCEDCVLFIDANEELLKEDIREISLGEFVAIYTDPSVRQILHRTVRQQLLKQLEHERSRADATEYRLVEEVMKTVTGTSTPQ